jgi:dTDP-4-amino-4,6-dideoxygalactose transaminase
MIGLSRIPFNGLARQYKNHREEFLAATDHAMHNGQWMNGEFTDQFQRWLKLRTGKTYAVLTHSGTTALEAIARYYKKVNFVEDTAFIPTLTFPATANAFINAGFNIELVDCNSYGQTIYGRHFSGGIDKPGIAVGVGLYGETVDQRPALPFVEDGAQHWLTDSNTASTAMAISFDPTKNLPSSGNGGAVVTNNRSIYDWVSSYFNHGKDTNVIGSNARMSELEAAHMMVRTQYIDEWQQRRRDIAEHYMERLKDKVRVVASDKKRHSWHKFVIDVDGRDKLRRDLGERGIETRIHYDRPLHEMPKYEHYKNPGLMSVASSLSRRVLSLPIYPELTDAEVEIIADQVRNHNG